MKKKKFVLIEGGDSRRFNLSYEFPGGGIELGESVLTAAMRETQEEARITVDKKTCVDSKIYYAYEFPSLSKYLYGWFGVANFVCLGRKKRKYKGYIKKADRDSFVDYAEWVYPQEIKDLIPCHKYLIKAYLQDFQEQTLARINGEDLIVL